MRVGIQAIILVVVVTLFQYVFQPFSYDFEEHRFSFFTISLLNGFLVSFVFLIFITILKTLTPNFFRRQQWTVGKEIGFWAVLLLAIGIGMFFRRELIYNNPNNLSFRYLITEVVNTFLVGSLIAIVSVMINYIQLLKSTTKKAKTWDKLVQNFRKDQYEDPSITITAKSPKDNINFRLSEIVYATSDGNYVEFYLQDQKGKISRYIKRNTLSGTEEQLSNHPSILRTHRSYLVNIHKIDSVRGNAQGYKLTLTGIETQIPVSRNHIPSFEAAMEG
jgi:hypothetical protein